MWNMARVGWKRNGEESRMGRGRKQDLAGASAVEPNSLLRPDPVLWLNANLHQYQVGAGPNQPTTHLWSTVRGEVPGLPLCEALPPSC